MEYDNEEIVEQEGKIAEKEDKWLTPIRKENIKGASPNDGDNNNNRFSILEEEKENDNESHEELQEKTKI